MTKLVEFTRDMRPYTKGDRCAVPDELADRLVATGEAVVRPSFYDKPASEPERPARYRNRAIEGRQR